MGHVIGAVEVLPDGTTRPIAGLKGVLGSRDALLELQYAYAPSLLPSGPAEIAGMWRYRSLLPLDDGPILYPLAVGGTPLLAPPGLRRLTGLPHLWVKDETRSPTGSNKDRATALILEHALREDATVVTAASTGNVAVSLAVGAAAAGLQAVIFVPADVREGKLRLMLLAGATVFTVKEGYEAAFGLSRLAASTFGWFDRNTGVNPMSMEAKKTVAFEIWEQLGRAVPDVMVVPVGDGTTLSAIAKGFREIVACGGSTGVPRLIGVQAKGCKPLKHVWEEGVPWKALSPGTCADGIAVTAPINGMTAVRDVRASGGSFVEVSDEAILRAIPTLAASSGILAEPASAAGYAGLEVALTEGLAELDETIVVLHTGTGLKTPQYLEPAGGAFAIEARLQDVQAALPGLIRSGTASI